MLLTDYHLHSTCSSDGHNTMLEMANASYENGVRTLCFTDHVDLDYYLTGEPDSNCFSNREKMNKMYGEALRGIPGEMKVFLGIELGEGNHNPLRAMEISASEELDFILGSVHNIKEKPDFYDIKYNDEKFCRELIEIYLTELLELARIDCFDVMAHIGYPVRYIRSAGFNLDISLVSYRDEIKQILQTLNENGKGIEINCSGFRNPLIGGTIPSVDVLQLYKELGGEIITVGSDAHMTKHAGTGLREGFDILKQLGYKYVTVFEKRKPQFLKI